MQKNARQVPLSTAGAWQMHADDPGNPAEASTASTNLERNDFLLEKLKRLLTHQGAEPVTHR